MRAPLPSRSYNEFERESGRIDEYVWAAAAIAPRSSVLFCGFENSQALITRALREQCRVTVIETDSAALLEAESLGCTTIRGSTSAIQYRGEAFTVAVAHYYLHKVDPSFHPQIVGELARVSRRIALVEPGPPTDLLGSRIASLYARAKRSRGEFEQYQDVEYWRRLLGNVRPIVVPSSISYGAFPPRAFLRDSVRIMLDLMRIEGVRRDDLRELEALAAASDLQLVPQPRHILLAAASVSEIPARPRMNELEALAPNRVPVVSGLTSGKTRARRTVAKVEDVEQTIPVQAAVHTPPPVAATPVVPTPPVLFQMPAPATEPRPARPVRPAAAPTAFGALGGDAPLPFGIPSIPHSGEPAEDLFKQTGTRAHWDQDDLPEMPDFGFSR